MRGTFTLFIASIILLGCTNNYEKFYVDELSKSTIDRSRLIPTVGEPEIISGSDNKSEDSNRMHEDGYIMIGYSSFHATGGATPENLLTQAKKVGAAKVLYYQKYMSTETGTTQLTLPTTETTYHSGTVSAYGSGGNSAYGSYGGTSTTYGTQTTNIPYTRHRYDYGASYWIKQKMPVFGVRVRDPNTQERSDAGTNKGAIIIATIRGGPAYKADLVPGDLITKVNQEEVYGYKDLLSKLRGERGRLVSFEVLRKGKKISKQIQLNN